MKNNKQYSIHDLGRFLYLGVVDSFVVVMEFNI